jgi:tRNA pseudouridine38-40 synthase
MPRFFLEVSYMGTQYSGFQVQLNANTVQAEVEKAMEILLKKRTELTGSSRTDAGVHALQNFFHFDCDAELSAVITDKRRFLYNMNALLPSDIAVKEIIPVSNEAHCRFDALSRKYDYYIARSKDPFLYGRSYFFPYKLDIEKLQEAAVIIKEYTDFTSFSKRNTQVKTFQCRIDESSWIVNDKYYLYTVTANRFLRGMVRGLTATMLKVGRGRITIAEYRDIIESRDCTKASFAVPAEGLFLVSVNFSETLQL